MVTERMYKPRKNKSLTCYLSLITGDRLDVNHLKGGYKMTLAQFIKENREELDKCIQKACPGAPHTDSERRLWILNDEGLYNWARSEGVKI